MRIRLLLVASLILICSAVAQPGSELTVHGTEFRLDGKPFAFTGISFFNAIYNPTFNKTPEEQRQWLDKFRKYGINVLRIWAQWDNPRTFVDLCPTCTLYYNDGRLRQEHVQRLKAILRETAAKEMVVELALFSHESFSSNIRLEPGAADAAVAALTKELMPHRNLVLQVWNEHSDRVLDHVKTIKRIDPKRLVTNSPGFAGVLGDPRQNAALDYLSPHTTRQRQGRPWLVGPAEIAYLLARYRKPVVDDEPARNGTINFGGPGEQTYPTDHILQIWEVWKLGAGIVYHHDMFQTGYGTPPIPPSGIPDPEFNPYHRAVLEFISRRDRYAPSAR
jgi:hypothetical protein